MRRATGVHRRGLAPALRQPAAFPPLPLFLARRRPRVLRGQSDPRQRVFAPRRAGFLQISAGAGRADVSDDARRSAAGREHQAQIPTATSGLCLMMTPWCGQAIAARLSATPAQILMAWQIRIGVSINPRSISAAHQQDALDALELVPLLTEDDLAILMGAPQVTGRFSASSSRRFLSVVVFRGRSGAASCRRTTSALRTSTSPSPPNRRRCWRRRQRRRQRRRLRLQVVRWLAPLRPQVAARRRPAARRARASAWGDSGEIWGR